MDAIRSHNEKRWKALAAAGAIFTRPHLDLSPDLARSMVDPFGLCGPLQGRSVLCLASGGGQQSAAFGVLGARVTVVDLCESQLARDRAAAEANGTAVETIHADMRDLSCLATAAFDLVHQPYSINFVPDPAIVFAEVARVLRPGALYFLQFANPFALGVSPSSWSGAGYPVGAAYDEEGPLEVEDQAWVYRGQSPPAGSVPPSIEFRHGFSRIFNGLASRGFSLLRLRDHERQRERGEPGSWAHFKSVLPPWLELCARLRPELTSELPA
jgi:SAM-dependent methyltransferase